MSVSLLFALSSLGLQSGLAGGNEALELGDYHTAWNSIGSERNDLAAWSGRARILYGAGDPAGAAAAAHAGLAIDPGQIDLIYHAAGASIWLEDGRSAVDYSERLLRAAEGLDALGPAERSAWQEVARDFAARSHALVEHERGLSRLLVRLKFISLGGVAFWVLVLWGVLRGQGRSSNPVS